MAPAKNPKGEAHAYPARHRDRNSGRFHRLVSLTDRWENPFRFAGSLRNDGPYDQSTASALPRLQHHFLTSRAVESESSLCKERSRWTDNGNPNDRASNMQRMPGSLSPSLSMANMLGKCCWKMVNVPTASAMAGQLRNRTAGKKSSPQCCVASS